MCLPLSRRKVAGWIHCFLFPVQSGQTLAGASTKHLLHWAPLPSCWPPSRTFLLLWHRNKTEGLYHTRVFVVPKWDLNVFSSQFIWKLLPHHLLHNTSQKKKRKKKGGCENLSIYLLFIAFTHIFFQWKLTCCFIVLSGNDKSHPLRQNVVLAHMRSQVVTEVLWWTSLSPHRPKNTVKSIQLTFLARI